MMCSILFTSRLRKNNQEQNWQIKSVSATCSWNIDTGPTTFYKENLMETVQKKINEAIKYGALVTVFRGREKGAEDENLYLSAFILR